MRNSNELLDTRRASAQLAAARLWLALGTLVVLLVPAARGTHVSIGWLPFWLVLAPAATLVGLRMLREPGWPFETVRRMWARGQSPQARRLQERSGPRYTTLSP